MMENSKPIKNLVFLGLLGLVLSSLTFAHPNDKDQLGNLGKGTRIVLKTTLTLLANANFYPLNLKTNEKGEITGGCKILFESSPDERTISGGRSIIFSGKFISYDAAPIEKPSALTEIRCFGEENNIGGLKKSLVGIGKLELAVPKPISEWKGTVPHLAPPINSFVHSN